MTEKTGKLLIRELSIVKEMLRKKDEQWVKASTILRLTGWNKDQLRRAYMRGEILRKKDKTGIWYDANSLLTIHLEKKTA